MIPNPIDHDRRPNGRHRLCGEAKRAGSGTAATAPAPEGGSVTLREIWYHMMRLARGAGRGSLRRCPPLPAMRCSTPRNSLPSA